MTDTTKKMCDYITIPRSIFRDESLDDNKFSRREAFLYLVQRATYREQVVPVKGGRVELKRGQLCASVRFLADTWGWSKDKVSRTLSDFVSERRIDIFKDTLTSIISIVNYDQYQPSSDAYKDTDKDTYKDTDKDSDKDTNKDTNKDKYNKDNKDNKDNKQKKTSNDVKENTSRFVKPSVEEIEAYCQEEGFNIDANKFFNYYESKGWVVGKSPMKNWKAAVNTWVSNNKVAYNGGDQLFPDNQPQQQKKREPVSGFTVVSGGFDF